jgi:hypothetical protein
MGDGHVIGVIECPRAQRLDEGEQALPRFVEGVIHPGWHLVVVGATDQPVVLEVTQGPGQCLLGDAADPAEQCAVAVDAVVDGGQDQYRPLVGDQVQHGPGRAAATSG